LIQRARLPINAGAALAALEMGREDVNQLPRVLNGSVAGIISRGDVL
jgi:hypothetical protein